MAKPTKAQLRKLAKKTAEQIVACELQLEGFCFEWAALFVKEAQERGWNAVPIRGVFSVDDPESLEEDESFFVEGSDYSRPVHHWAQVGNVIVDATAQQFDDFLEIESMPEVVVGTYEEWPRYEPRGQQSNPAAIKERLLAY